jgi:hypothetical protein
MMKFTADVVHQAPRPHEEDRFCTVPVEGDNAMQVAQRVAELAARRRYGDDGETGYVVRINANTFAAAIGTQSIVDGQAKLDGVTIKITLTPDDEDAQWEQDNYVAF